MTEAVVKKVTLFELTVQLTGDEAKALMGVMGIFTGRDHGPRGVTTRIWQALHRAGVSSKDIEFKFKKNLIDGKNVDSVWLCSDYDAEDD